MFANRRSLKGRYISFCLGCIAVIGILHALFSKIAEWVPTFSSHLFPTLTIFLLVFDLFIACFMAMKYWCDRKRLYLVSLAFAFAGSASLTTSVTVWPASMPVVVPLIGAAAALALQGRSDYPALKAALLDQGAIL